MRFELIIFLVTIYANPLLGSRGYPGPGNSVSKLHRILLDILKQLYQPTTNNEHLAILSNFTFESIQEEESSASHNDPIRKINNWHKKGLLLPRDAAFSIFNPEHKEQVDILIEVFLFSRYTVLNKFAVWARENLNLDMFLYSLSYAILNKPHENEITLPPIYELNPYYHFPSKILQEVNNIKLTNKNPNSTILVNSEYSSDSESTVPYFTEDVGINAYYYYFHLYFAVGQRRSHYREKNNGEIYYYFLQQLLAKYNLERISNNLGKIPNFQWVDSFNVPYKPSIRYSHGLNFPSRPGNVDLHTTFLNYAQTQFWKSTDEIYQNDITDYERRLKKLIKAGSVELATEHYGNPTKTDIYNDEGINTLGEIISGHFKDRSKKMYFNSIDTLGRKYLGYSYSELNENVPSVLEHYETSLRDPAIFLLYKKIISYFDELLEHIPPYTKTDLLGEGISISKIEFDRLETFFDLFDSDVTNSIVLKPGETVKAFIRQKRLNNKPFNYSIAIKSDKPLKAAIKIFLGPKKDESGNPIKLAEHRNNFFEFDNILYDLQSGENLITRQSTENEFFAKDFTSFDDLYKEIDHDEQIHYNDVIPKWERRTKFPQRFMLPKGSKSGVDYQFFVYVYPIHNNKTSNPWDRPPYPKFNRDVDNHPLGYPLNRIIKDEAIWLDLPNAHFHGVKIYHLE